MIQDAFEAFDEPVPGRLAARAIGPGRVRDELRGRGVTVDGDVVPRRGAFGSGPSLYIQDPDGYRIELKPR